MRMSAPMFAVAILSLLLCWTAGCDRGGGPEPSPADPQAGDEAAPESPVAGDSVPEEINVLCGTSFGPPMEELKDRYKKATGGEVILTFGGSEDHLPKVKLKSTGDVYVSHTPYMQYTRDANAMLREVEVGFLAPVLVAQKGNPKGLERIEDLAQPGLKVVLPNPDYSTCGEMVFGLLEKKGIKDAVMANVGNDLVKHHAQVGNQLKLGARDAGIMWNGVAHNFLDSIELVPIPYEYDEEIRVAVMGLSYTKKKESVERFLDFVAKHGKDVFQAYNYVKVEPGSDEAESETPTPEPSADEAATDDLGPGRLLLFCGAGLRPPVAEAVEQFTASRNTTIECDYAGSEVQLSRIKLTGRGDLYMPGDVHYVNLAADQGLIRSQQDVCYFVPVIMVRKGNPKDIRNLKDLVRPGIKLGLGDPKACAIGRTASTIFEKSGIDESNLPVAFRAVTVNELGNHVQLGTLDAAIVWDAVAAQFADDAETVAIPAEQNVISTVGVGVLKSSEHPQHASAFVDYLTSAEGRATFRKHGYTVDSPL